MTDRMEADGGGGFEVVLLAAYRAVRDRTSSSQPPGSARGTALDIYIRLLALITPRR